MVAFWGLVIYGVAWLARRESSADRGERGATRADGVPAAGPQAPARQRRDQHRRVRHHAHRHRRHGAGTGFARLSGILTKPPLADRPAVKTLRDTLAKVASPAPVRVLAMSYGQTKASVADFAAYAKDKAAGIELVKTTIPLVIGILAGIALIIAAAMTIRDRRRPPSGLAATAEPREQRPRRTPDVSLVGPGALRSRDRPGGGATPAATGALTITAAIAEAAARPPGRAARGTAGTPAPLGGRAGARGTSGAGRPGSGAVARASARVRSP